MQINGTAYHTLFFKGTASTNSFGVTAIPITSLDDLKDLPKKISDAIEGAFGGSRNRISEYTSFKMNMSEYEELGIKTGDKIILEIKISNNDNRA